MKRGRPKGKSSDTRSYGPLGDLIRKHRLEKRLGLADVAKAVSCSVQFISNIEHGRAPLPWEKVPSLANFLRIPAEELQVANLAIRSDFKSFTKTTRGKKKPGIAGVQAISMGTASALAATAKDPELQELIEKYQSASTTSRKKFLKSAIGLLSN